MGFVTDWEDDMIPPDQWQELYDEMPLVCQRQVDGPDLYPVGIGRNEEHGWFVCTTGQGPFIIWSEKVELEREKKRKQKKGELLWEDYDD